MARVFVRPRKIRHTCALICFYCTRKDPEDVDGCWRHSPIWQRKSWRAWGQTPQGRLGLSAPPSASATSAVRCRVVGSCRVLPLMALRCLIFFIFFRLVLVTVVPFVVLPRFAVARLSHTRVPFSYTPRQRRLIGYGLWRAVCLAVSTVVRATRRSASAVAALSASAVFCFRHDARASDAVGAARSPCGRSAEVDDARGFQCTTYCHALSST